jgi:hypothetical protein
MIVRDLGTQPWGQAYLFLLIVEFDFRHYQSLMWTQVAVDFPCVPAMNKLVPNFFNDGANAQVGQHVLGIVNGNLVFKFAPRKSNGLAFDGQPSDGTRTADTNGSLRSDL